MTTADTNLEERVRAMMTSLTTVPADQIRPEMTLRVDLGLDSVSSLELLGLISEEFGVDIELEETAGIETVGDVVKMIRERTAHA